MSSASDVYAFGVILLELITGWKAMDESQPRDRQRLLDRVRRLHAATTNILQSTALHRTALHRTALHYIALHDNDVLLHCTHLSIQECSSGCSHLKVPESVIGSCLYGLMFLIAHHFINNPMDIACRLALSWKLAGSLRWPTPACTASSTPRSCRGWRPPPGMRSGTRRTSGRAWGRCACGFCLHHWFLGCPSPCRGGFMLSSPKGCWIS